jgi:tRNA threonylcarbamoyladenosine biosynthesis protein TsaB
MILIISTTERFKFTIGLDKEIFEFETQNQSSDILPKIQKVLANKNVTLSDLRAILVNIGPGSYTGIRIGVTVANTLAWSLNIPVYGYKENELRETLSRLESMTNDHFTHPALPHYENK